MVEFEKRVDVRDTRYFDVLGRHPNIVRPKSTNADLLAVWNYCTKDKVVYGNMPTAPQLRSINDTWHDAVWASSKEEFFDIIKNGDPRSLVMGWSNVSAYAERWFTVPLAAPPPRVFSDNLLDPLMIMWRDVERHQAERPKSLIIVGPSRLGKTEWARSLGPHCYFGGMFDLSQINVGHDEYAVFDDVKQDGLEWYKQMVGAQRVVTLSDKYIKKRTFVWGKPTIWLFNDLDMHWREDRWLSANAIIVDINQPLF